MTTPADSAATRLTWSYENEWFHRLLAIVPWMTVEVLGWFVGLVVDGFVHGFRRGRNLW